MAKIVTFNDDLNGNSSYAHTMRRLIDKTQSFEWYYGSNTYTGPPVKMDKYMLVPSNDVNHTLGSINPDIVFMHNDPQRCMWLQDVHNAATCWWAPLDNEDPRERELHHLIRRVSRPLVVSKFAQEYFNKWEIETEQIYNPVDTDLFKFDKDRRMSIRQNFGIKDDEKLLLYVGRLSWRKRIPLLIQIFSQIHLYSKKVKLFLLSDLGDPELGFRLEELLHANDILDGRTVMWPRDYKYNIGVPGQTVRDIMCASDLYITPHGGEGMGLPIVEAMACGVPFIATDTTTTKEFAGYEIRNSEMIGKRGIGVKCSPVTMIERSITRPFPVVKEFVDKAINLLEDDKLRRKLSHGREFVEKEMSCNVIANKFSFIFNEISDKNEVKVI